MSYEASLIFPAQEPLLALYELSLAFVMATLSAYVIRYAAPCCMKWLIILAWIIMICQSGYVDLSPATIAWFIVALIIRQ